MNRDRARRRWAKSFVASADGWQMRWQGMWTIQNPFDVWAVAEIVYRTRPEVLVETGTHTGGSAHLWATLLGLNGGKQVITVDPDHSKLKGDAVAPPLPIRFVRGDSVKKYSTIERLVAGRRTMVILDSDHHADHVRRELNHYSQLVTPGCYLIVQDTGAGHDVDVGYDGPWQVVLDFVAAHPEFEIDRDVEPTFTVCPHGYLRARSFESVAAEVSAT